MPVAQILRAFRPPVVSSRCLMATIKPFAALRPKPGLAAQICELPYDVMSSDEARKIAAGNPLSFLHVSKPEIDLPPGTDPCAPEVYAKGRENFQKLIRDGALKQDSQPCFYLYRQIMGDTFAGRPGRRGELRGISARCHQKARADAAGQGGRPRPAHRSPQCANRPGVSDLPGQRRHWTNLSRRKFPRNRTLISPPGTACGTRPG